jgi:hypothetical protein
VLVPAVIHDRLKVDTVDIGLREREAEEVSDLVVVNTLLHSRDYCNEQAGRGSPIYSIVLDIPQVATVKAFMGRLPKAGKREKNLDPTSVLRDGQKNLIALGDTNAAAEHEDVEAGLSRKERIQSSPSFIEAHELVAMRIGIARRAAQVARLRDLEQEDAGWGLLNIARLSHSATTGGTVGNVLAHSQVFAHIAGNPGTAWPVARALLLDPDTSRILEQSRWHVDQTSRT